VTGINRDISQFKSLNHVIAPADVTFVR
jgi:hypothetical protein